MTALVTGGSGYFGSLLVDLLRARGQATRNFDLVDMDDRPKDVEFVRGDIRDLAAISGACKGAETIYHCVAQVPLARDKHLFESVNIGGTKNLMEAAQAAGARKVVIVSSSAVFGIPDRNPVNEETAPKPVEAYGRAKLEAENLARKFAAERGLEVAIIRPRTILGHGRLGIFQLLFDFVADGHNIYVMGRGDNTYQFVHAEDLADACIRAADRPGSGTYNIGAERYSTMREALEGLAAHAGTGSKVKSLPMRPAIFAMSALSKMRLAPFVPYQWIMYGRSLWFDTSKARRELGWSSKWSNTEMIAQSYDWYLKNREKVLATTSGASTHRMGVKQGALKVLRWFS